MNRNMNQVNEKISELKKVAKDRGISLTLSPDTIYENR